MKAMYFQKVKIKHSQKVQAFSALVILLGLYLLINLIPHYHTSVKLEFNDNDRCVSISCLHLDVNTEKVLT